MSDEKRKTKLSISSTKLSSHGHRVGGWGGFPTNMEVGVGSISGLSRT